MRVKLITNSEASTSIVFYDFQAPDGKTMDRIILPLRITTQDQKYAVSMLNGVTLVEERAP